jgi:hypothetical protein
MSEIISKIFANTSKENSRSGFGFNSDRLSNRFDLESDSLNESLSSIVTSFSVYKLLSDIIKPFTSLRAYSAGVIDGYGNILDPKSSLLTPYVRLVIGIKRLVQGLPATKMRAEMGYIPTAAKVMAFECAQLGGDEKLFLEELDKAIKFLMEEGEGAAPIGNSMGAGFSNPQVGENPNNALAGLSPPLNFIKRRKKRLK